MSVDEKVDILMVDDHPENLLALEAVLGDLGQNLIRAHSGADALKHLLVQDFAVILLDVQMPGLDGFETAALIRERERSRHTPIVFLTAINKTETHVTRGYSVGAVDYVFKPFEPEVLKAKVGAFVELSRKNKELLAEIGRRKQAEAEIRRLNDRLERRVLERTTALNVANQGLEAEIAERKRAEEVLTRHQAHIEALNERLKRAMTETHHRVKNNLQIIAAMVDMLLMNGPEGITPDTVRQLGWHVRTLAAIHDILTQEAKQDGQAHFLSARDVLEKLLPLLRETTKDRSINLECVDVALTARQGTSLGLIVNELISNALKHASGAIYVALSLQDENTILTVSDDGPGFASDFDPIAAANTGLDLIGHLSQWDLGGRVCYENRPEGGALVAVTFPSVSLPTVTR